MVKMRINMALILSLFIITAAIYIRAAYFPFCAIDDSDYVTRNIHVKSGLSLNSIKWAFTTFHSTNWHPVTWLSLMLDSQLFGVNPMGFHLVNVFLHALNTSLLFLLFSSLTGAVWRSAFVAACFALHPLHVESVAWIAERKDVLSTLFWMLTLLFYSCYVKRSKRSMYYLSLLAFALGLMAKPMLVTIPVILILLDFWPLERIKTGRLLTVGTCNGSDANNNIGCLLKPLIVEKIPFVLLAAGSSAVTLFAQKPSIAPLMQVTLYMRISNALRATLLYVEKMIFPFNLSIYYPLVPVPLWKAVCAAVIICSILLIVLKCADSQPYLAAGWFWYLITLLPVVGIIQIGRQSMADRYSYIPLIGLFAMASWGGAELCTKMPKLKNVISLVAVGVVLLYAVTTWNQLSYWHNNISLISHAIEVTENNAFAHYVLGNIYRQQGKLDLAAAEYRISLRIDPDNPEAHFNLGNCFVSSGSIEEAISEYREALKIDPNNYEYHNNLGNALALHGILDAAIEQFSIALQLNPDNEKIKNNLQRALTGR